MVVSFVTIVHRTLVLYLLLCENDVKELAWGHGNIFILWLTHHVNNFIDVIVCNIYIQYILLFGCIIVPCNITVDVSLLSYFTVRPFVSYSVRPVVITCKHHVFRDLFFHMFDYFVRIKFGTLSPVYVCLYGPTFQQRVIYM